MAASDDYTSVPQPPLSYSASENVTPSDSVELTHVSRALMNTGTAGVATCIMQGGQTAILYFPQGIIQPVRVKRVNATSLGAGVVLVSLY